MNKLLMTILCILSFPPIVLAQATILNFTLDNTNSLYKSTSNIIIKGSFDNLSSEPIEFCHYMWNDSRLDIKITDSYGKEIKPKNKVTIGEETITRNDYKIILPGRHYTRNINLGKYLRESLGNYKIPVGDYRVRVMYLPCSNTNLPALTSNIIYISIY